MAHIGVTCGTYRGYIRMTQVTGLEWLTGQRLALSKTGSLLRNLS